MGSNTDFMAYSSRSNPAFTSLFLLFQHLPLQVSNAPQQPCRRAASAFQLPRACLSFRATHQTQWIANFTAGASFSTPPSRLRAPSNNLLLPSFKDCCGNRALTSIFSIRKPSTKRSFKGISANSPPPPLARIFSENAPPRTIILPPGEMLNASKQLTSGSGQLTTPSCDA